MHDAIIILGAGLQNREIGERTEERVRKGVELFDAKCAPILVMSGGTHSSSGISAAETMKQFAISLGVRESAILIEDRSGDTIGNALNCLELYCIPRRWKSVLLVTSDYHSARAEYVFRKVFGKAIEIEVAISGSGFSQERLCLSLAHEHRLLLYTRLLLGAVPGGSRKLVRYLEEKCTPTLRRFTKVLFATK